jgi:sugar fermentation stimulation protein A
MWELLLPRTTVYLETNPAAGDKMPYTAVAVEKEGQPVMVHTHRTNDLANDLIQRNLVPGLEGVEVTRREIKRGRSRFDFLLRRGKEEIFLEVKSCTLFGKKLAMFPDAPTARGKRHVEELVSLSEEGFSGIVLFLVFSPRARFFMPEYHTDLEFTRTLLAAREKISILPLAVQLRADLSLTPRVRVLEVPWEIVEKEARDSGSYILILRVRENSTISIGGLGEVKFRKGYYLYVGSARRNLSSRLERHRRRRKRLFWHVDFLRAAAEFHFALPFRTQDILECSITRAVSEIAQWKIPGFGCSDCLCSSHLYGMAKDPLQSAAFISLLQYYRMDRLKLNHSGIEGLKDCGIGRLRD